MSAEPDALAAAGLNLAGIAAIKAAREAALRLMRAELHQRPVVNSWDKLIDYCSAQVAHGKIEEFHILFLDRKNVLIKDERQQRGTVDHTPVHPREVVKRALELGASALILVHNHPSGDPTPSKGPSWRGVARPCDHRPQPPHQPARARGDLAVASGRLPLFGCRQGGRD